MIFLWDAATKQLIIHFQAEKHLRNIVFSPDGHIVAASDDTGSILLCEVATGRILHRLVHPAENTTTSSRSTMAFTPDGKQLMSGASNTLIFWNTTTGKQVGKP